MLEDSTVIRTYFDRRHNILAAYMQVGPLHRDLELHLLSIGASHDPATVAKLKDGLVGLSLYQVSRPRFESLGWTLSLQSPPLSLFFTGSCSDDSVVGRAFLEGLEPSSKSLFYSQVTRSGGEPQTSHVEVTGTDVLRMVEQFCVASDQQPVRYFRGQTGSLAFLSALPDADLEWMARATVDEVLCLEASETLKLLSRRAVTFRCGCDRARITSVGAQLFRGDPDDLFRGDSIVEAECPRCGTKHVIDRAGFDAALSPGS